MVGQKRREKDLKWESFRPEIERRFSDDNQGLEQIMEWLGQEGFRVTKNQLNYRLNKIWGVRRRAPKGQATEFWRRVDQLPDPTRDSLIVTPHGQRRQRMRTRNPGRQIERHNIGTHSNNVGLTPQLSGCLQVAPGSPTPERSLLPWPQDLPWLLSAIQRLEIRSSRQNEHPSTKSVPVSKYLQYLAIGESSQKKDLSETRLVTSFANEIPELHAGDALRRARIVLSGSSKMSVEERLKLLLLKLSNNSIRVSENNEDSLLEFDHLLGLVENSGLPATPLALQGQDITIRAVCDTLFQETFLFILYASRSKYKLRYDLERARSLLEWLLNSGQDPNTPIIDKHSFGIEAHTTGLKISLCLFMSGLATRLLDCRASPAENGYSNSNTFMGYKHHHLPPLFLALRLLTYSDQPETHQMLLSRIEHFGLQSHELAISPYKQGGLALIETSNTPIFCMLQSFTDVAATSVVQYLFNHVDASGNTVYRNMVDWKSLFINASRSGKLGVLKFLLSYQNRFPASNVLTAHDYVNWGAQNGLTALHAAAASRVGDPVEICKLLLQNGATLESDDSRHPSPLHLACTVGSLETVEFLYSSGASVNKRCEFPKDICRRTTKMLPTGIPTLGTPLEFNAAFSFSYTSIRGVETRKICKYLIENGSEAPSNSVPLLAAMRQLDVDLFFVFLELAVQGNHHMLPESIFTDTITKMGGNLPRLTREEMGGIRTRMAHLLLDAGARPQVDDAVQAAFLGDWYLVTRVFAVVPDIISQTWETTLLEAAILSCDLDTAKKAFESYPNHYSAGALCAAALVATRNGGDFGFIEALLNNRLGCLASAKQPYQEMAAIGIAAYSGNWELLQLLKRKLPWSQQAMVPNYHIGPSFKPLKLPGHDARGFWHDGKVGSVQMFSAQAEERIFSLFVNQDSPLTAQCVVALIMGDKTNHNRVWTWIKAGHRIDKDDDYSEADNPLRHAIRVRDISLVRACPELGANIDGYAPSPRGMEHTDKCPLVEAIEWGLSDIAGLLINKGACVNSLGSGYSGDTPLFTASRTGQLGVVRMLLSMGANPNEPINIPQSDAWRVRDGCTPIEAAAKDGRLDITHLLLANGVKTEGSGQLQYIRAIALASRHCHLQVERMLKSHRQWTKADDALLNDPELFNLKDYSDEGPSSYEYHSEESEESDEIVAGLTPLATEAGETILAFESEDTVEVRREDTSQQVGFWPSSGIPGVMGDPFLGTGDDMPDVCVWEDLDSNI